MKPHILVIRIFFSFELSWFEKELFLEIVARYWAKPVPGRSNMEHWQNKIRHLRQFLSCWAKNESGMYKQEKRMTYSVDSGSRFESRNEYAR